MLLISSIVATTHTMDTPGVCLMPSNVRTLLEIKEIHESVFVFLQNVHKRWNEIDEMEMFFAKDLMGRICDHICSKESLDLLKKKDCLVLTNNNSEYIIVSMNENEKVSGFYLEGDVEDMIRDPEMEYVVMYLVATV